MEKGLSVLTLLKNLNNLTLINKNQIVQVIFIKLQLTLIIINCLINLQIFCKISNNINHFKLAPINQMY